MFVALIGVIWLLCFLGIPILALFSIREWATNYRATLPAFRSGIGLLSVGAIFFGWLFLVALAILGIFNTTSLDFFTQKRNLDFLVLAVAASPGCWRVIGSVCNAVAFQGDALSSTPDRWNCGTACSTARPPGSTLSWPADLQVRFRRVQVRQPIVQVLPLRNGGKNCTSEATEERPVHRLEFLRNARSSSPV